MKIKALKMLVALVVVVAGLGTQTVFAQAAVAEPPIISVVGMGEVVVAPDMATVFITVSLTAPEPAAALAQASAVTENVIEAIAALGVADTDIRTASLTVWEEFEWGMDGSRRSIGHNATNTLLVVIRDLDIAGYVLGMATEAGATSIGNLQFDVADRNEAYNRALAIAVENAAGKARVIALATGGSLGAIVSVTEVPGWNMPVAFGGGIMPATAMAEADGFRAMVQPGELAVRAEVRIIYVLN